ncbi:MAG TPA: PAS domain S-box protein, partial [Terriglobales bacterium]|nr:PAS domain S-box protein [Terriglobales bacterium]
MLICALGLTVLIGWQIHATRLIQVMSALAPMQRLTAAGFLLSGIGLIFTNTGRKRATLVCALPLIVLGCAVLLEYLTGADFGIDQLLGPGYVTVQTSHPGRMSPVTALCFLVAGLALLVAGLPRLARFASATLGLLGSILAAVGFVNLLGFLFGRTEVYGWRHLTSMALHSSAAFGLLGCGLVLWAWRESKPKAGAPEWLPLSIGVGLAAASIGVWQALIAHEASELALISGIILAGGIFGSALVALAIRLAQRARQRSRELQETNDMLERFFEASPDALVMTNDQGRIVRLNRMAESAFGYKRDELLGRKRDLLFPAKLQQLHQVPGKPVAGSSENGRELQAQRKDGTEFAAELSFSSPGTTGEALAVVRDVTERKRVEAELRLGSEIFAHMEEAVCLIRVEDGIIVQANTKFEKMFGCGPGELVGKRVESLNADPHRSPEEVADEIRRELRRCGVWRGEIRHRRNDGTHFWCAVTGSVFHHPEFGNVGISIHQDITELKRAQETLRESEQRFRSVFEQSPIGLTLTGTDGRFIKVNSATCRILGYTEAELARMTPLDISHPDDRELTTDLIRGAFHNNDFTHRKVEKRYLKKNGETVWANLSVAVIRNRENKPLYGVGMIEDITERRRAEAEVRLGSEIFAHMEEAVCLVRVSDGVIVHANRKFEEMFGYGPNELAGRPVENINSRAHSHPEEVAEEIKAEVKRCGVWRGEILHQRKDGTPFWCAVTVSMFHHPEFGDVGISLHQDITELKEAQEALVESEERFRGIFEQGPIGVALLDGNNKMIKTNPAFSRMLGYSESELARMTPLDMTHPDDREGCTTLLQRLETGEIPVCKMEKRYVKKNGDLMWAGLTASVIRDGDGRPLYGLGMIEDVTERRQSQQKLAEQATLLDLARDTIAVRDLEGRIIFWNQGAQETYGWSAEEALGQRAHELLHSRYPVPLDEVERTVLSPGAWEGELEQVTRGGRKIVVISRWSLWRDESGEPRAFLVINRDITGRKEAEEQLHSLTERLYLATHIASIGIWDRDLRTNQVVWDDTLFE